MTMLAPGTCTITDSKIFNPVESSAAAALSSAFCISLVSECFTAGHLISGLYRILYCTSSVTIDRLWRSNGGVRVDWRVVFLNQRVVFHHLEGRFTFEGRIQKKRPFYAPAPVICRTADCDEARQCEGPWGRFLGAISDLCSWEYQR